MIWRNVVLSVNYWDVTDRRRPAGAALLWAALLGAALLLARAPLEVSLALFAGGALAVLTLIRPALGLALLALAVPFGSVREIALGPASIGLAELLALWVVAAWLARMVAQREVRVAGSRLWLALGLLLGAMLLSVTGALSLAASVKELSKWLEFGAIAVCAASLTRPAERRLIVGGALLAGAAAGLLGWYQFLLGIGPPGFILFGRFMRAYGTFRQPNPYAGYLGLILPVAVGLLISYWPWRRRTAYTWGERALWLLALAAAATTAPAILMSWSRGAWFGVAAGLLLVLLGRGRRWAALLVIAALALASVIFVAGLERYAPAQLTTRLTDFAGYFSWGDVSEVKPNPLNWAVIERMAHWQAAEGMFAAHPWLGVGIGNYAAVYPAYRLPRWADPLGHAHNYYLNIAAESGVIGLGLYLLFWLTAAGLTLKAVGRQAGVMPKSQKPVMLSAAKHLARPFAALRVTADTTLAWPYRQAGLWRGVALGILGALVHLSVHNLFDNLYVQGIYLQIALWLGLIVALARTGPCQSHASCHPGQVERNRLSFTVGMM